MKASLAELKVLIVSLANFYGYVLTDVQVELHAKVLEGTNIEDLKYAVAEIMADPNIKFYPLPAVILSKANPKSDPKMAATDLAKKIISALVKRGYTWTDTYHYDGHASFQAAVTFELGEIAWGVIQRRGGWQRVHDEFYEGSESTFTAQLRDHIQGIEQVSKRRFPDNNAVLPDLRGPRKILS